MSQPGHPPLSPFRKMETLSAFAVGEEKWWGGLSWPSGLVVRWRVTFASYLYVVAAAARQRPPEGCYFLSPVPTRTARTWAAYESDEYRTRVHLHEEFDTGRSKTN